MATVRAGFNFSKLYNVIARSGLLCSDNILTLQVRHNSKHWNPKWRWHRKMKVIKFELPDFHEKEPENLTREEIRSKMKKSGVLPQRHWNERPTYVSSTGGVFEPYVPPEGDGKVSMITTAGAKQKYELLEKKSKSMMAVRKIKSFDEDFDLELFVQEAQEVYINAHNALKSKDPEKLSEFVTERANPEMMNNIKNKTLHWTFLESIEPPRMVHARCTNLITNENYFAQATVRFHTKQILAIYDRFGRLLYGSEILAKDVLEYIVFEKHIVNQYGKWRVHDKIIPDWMPVGEPVNVTYQEPIADEVLKLEAEESSRLEKLKISHVLKPVK